MLLRFIFQFSLKARCTPCSLYFLDFVLNSCGVFHTTEAYPLVFIYMQGVFFAFRMSVGLCPQTMWCTPHYRGLSSCFFHLCPGCIPCNFYFCWTLSSDDVVYSTLQRDILYFEFVWALYKEASSVNFIVDRFSLPY